MLAKIREFRVEVGEIESALPALGCVREAAVAARPDRRDEKGLLAYIVPAARSAVRPTALRASLREKLPEYMIPEKIVILNAMPLTANGKIDRGALPDPDHSRPPLENPFTLPETPVEETMAKVWSQALNITAVGIHDNFFDLGGHSLAAMRIISKANEAFGIELSMRALLDTPTISGLAGVIETLLGSRPTSERPLNRSATSEEIGEL
jgi:acyl carrier protein